MASRTTRRWPAVTVSPGGHEDLDDGARDLRDRPAGDERGVAVGQARAGPPRGAALAVVDVGDLAVPGDAAGALDAVVGDPDAVGGRGRAGRAARRRGERGVTAGGAEAVGDVVLAVGTVETWPASAGCRAGGGSRAGRGGRRRGGRRPRWRGRRRGGRAGAAPGGGGRGGARGSRCGWRRRGSRGRRGCATSRSRLVVTPWISARARPAASRRAAAARVPACATTFAIIGSENALTVPDGPTRVLPAELVRRGRSDGAGPGGAVVLGGVLGVEPDLDGVAARAQVVLGERELGALGDAELEGDQVDAPDLLGDRVLDLQPGVHLEEEEPLVGAVAVEQELDGARADVPELLGQRDGRGAHAGPGARRRRRATGASSTTFWCRRWIEHSRSPRCTTFPCASAKTWISTWRGASAGAPGTPCRRRRTASPRRGPSARPRRDPPAGRRGASPSRRHPRWP